MLAGLLNQLDRRRVTVVSRTPAETQAMHDVRAVSVTGAITQLGHHRTIVIGGGALFSADMGAIGRGLPYYGLLANSGNRKVVIAGVSVDGVTGLHGAATKWLFGAADQVTVRDRRSLEIVREWRPDVHLVSDLSIAMPNALPAVGERLLKRAGVKSGRRVVGLALTNVNAAFAAQVARAVVETVNSRPDLEFCFIPMSQHPFVSRHNDLLFARQLKKQASRIRIVDGYEHPADILSAFGALSAVVGMRYHSLVFAERSGTPLVPLAYAPKCEAWLAERGLSSTSPTSDAVTDALRMCLAEGRAA